MAKRQSGYYEYATPDMVFKQQKKGHSDYRVEPVWIKGDQPAERSTDAELEKGFALRRDMCYIDKGGEDDFEYMQKLLVAGALSPDRVSKINEQEMSRIKAGAAGEASQGEIPERKPEEDIERAGKLKV